MSPPPPPQATMEAMRRAVSDVRGQLAKATKGKPSGEKSVVVAVDGNRVPKGIDQAPGVTAEAVKSTHSRNKGSSSAQRGWACAWCRLTYLCGVSVGCYVVVDVTWWWWVGGMKGCLWLRAVSHKAEGPPPAHAT